MSASEVVSSFMSRFHREQMKPRGYTKQRFVFSRRRDGYVERVRLQGSRWNHDQRPWRFSIEIGVEFDGLLTTSVGFPHTHLHGLLEEIVPEASGDYALRHQLSRDLGSALMDRLDPGRQEVRVADEGELMREIAAHLDLASARIGAAQVELFRRASAPDWGERCLAMREVLAR
jgi:hypothetical protein